MKVKNINCTEINYEAAVILMDEEIREEIANSFEAESEQEFFSLYEKKHIEKYGEEWELSKENPVY